MRRQDFIDGILCWSDLLNFCYNEDCSVCDDIYSEEARNEAIDNSLTTWARDYTWQELCDILRSIPSGVDYYRRDDWDDCDWYEADDDTFDEYKDRVLEWMDDGGYWDDEDEDVGDEPFDIIIEEEEEEDLAPIELDVSLADLFSDCNNGLKSIQNMRQEESEAEDKKFDSFVMSFTQTRGAESQEVMYI